MSPTDPAQESGRQTLQAAAQVGGDCPVPRADNSHVLGRQKHLTRTRGIEVAMGANLGDAVQSEMAGTSEPQREQQPEREQEREREQNVKYHNALLNSTE